VPAAISKNNVQTETCEHRARGLKIRFILPSLPLLRNRSNPADLRDILFSFHFGFSAAAEGFRRRLVGGGESKQPALVVARRELASRRPGRGGASRWVEAFDHGFRTLDAPSDVPEDLRKPWTSCGTCARTRRKVSTRRSSGNVKGGLRILVTKCARTAVRSLFGRSEDACRGVELERHGACRTCRGAQPSSHALRGSRDRLEEEMG
jgi:hypothetical protein